MKKEDKLLFLGELVGYDVSSFLNEKIDYFFNDGTMKEINNILKDNDNSPKYQRLLSEYEALKNVSITSIEDYILYTGKANYVLSSFKKRKYVNPLFDFEDKEMPISNITIVFDGKDEYLGDIILKDEYTNIYKIECVKTIIVNWYNEVKDSFLLPLENMIIKPHNLPKRRIISGAKIVYGIILLIVNILMVLSFFSNDEIIYSVLRFDFTQPKIIVYPVIVFSYLLLFSNILYVFSILRRYKYVKKYIEGQNMLKNTYYISKKVFNNSEKLYKDLLNCISNKSEVKGNIKKYCNLEIEYKTFLYMNKINNKNSLTKDVFFIYEIIIIQLLFIFISYFIIYYYVLSEVVVWV